MTGQVSVRVRLQLLGGYGVRLMPSGEVLQRESSEGVTHAISSLPLPGAPAHFPSRSEKMSPLDQWCQDHLGVCKKFKFMVTPQTY